MKRKLFLLGTFALIVAGGIFWSCQKEELLNPEEVTLKKGKVETLETTVPLTWEGVICAGQAHTFSIDAEVGTNLQVQMEVAPGDWTQIFQISQSVTSPQTFTYMFNEPGTFNLRVKTGSGGYSDNVPVEVISCGCDDATFSYETLDNMDILFKYNHDAEAELTLQFTFPQVENSKLVNDKYIAEDGKEYSVNNAKNQTVFTWSGIVGCSEEEAETFHFIHLPDCSAPPANDGQAIIWTDAKVIAVNGVPVVMVEDDPSTPEDETVIGYSIKGELSNIVYENCPIN